jgi:hypothetical protein
MLHQQLSRGHSFFYTCFTSTKVQTNTDAAGSGGDLCHTNSCRVYTVFRSTCVTSTKVQVLTLLLLLPGDLCHTNSCRVYTVHSELTDVTEEVGLDATSPTLYAAATPAGVLVQVLQLERRVRR